MNVGQFKDIMGDKLKESIVEKISYRKLSSDASKHAVEAELQIAKLKIDHVTKLHDIRVMPLGVGRAPTSSTTHRYGTGVYAKERPILMEKLLKNHGKLYGVSDMPIFQDLLQHREFVDEEFNYRTSLRDLYSKFKEDLDLNEEDIHKLDNDILSWENYRKSIGPQPQPQH